MFSSTISDEVKLDFEEPTMMMNNLDRSNNTCLAEQKLYTSFNDESRQLICNEHTSRSGSGDSMERTPRKFSLQLQGERSALVKYGNKHLQYNFLPRYSIVQVSKCLKLTEFEDNITYALK